MIYTIVCQAIAILTLVFFVVVLMGYWTGANYYFKLDSDSVGCAAIVNMVGWLFWGVVQILGATTDARPPEFSHNFSWGIIGTIDMLIILVVLISYGYSWFEKSREYFWNKRGR